VLYLEPFAHTVAVLQTSEALRRVARECVEDLADDGVVYAEVRFAPELHLEGELTLDEVVEAVLEGFRDATGSARTPAGDPIAVGLLCTAMRTVMRSLNSRSAIATAASLDSILLAPRLVSRPRATCRPLSSSTARTDTHPIHAGEGFGLPSIWEALQLCGAARLGHGVRIVDDITEQADGTTSWSAWLRSTTDSSATTRSRCPPPMSRP